VGDLRVDRDDEGGRGILVPEPAVPTGTTKAKTSRPDLGTSDGDRWTASPAMIARKMRNTTGIRTM
jgi:hypothetical protein